MPDSERIAVLVIDDEIRTDDALVRLLSLDGFAIACAGTGNEGIGRALSGEWDAVILDLHLPDVLGITVLSDLRRRGFSSPVLVMTGWYGDGHQDAAMALGAAGFVRKPIAADELGVIVRTAVDRNRAGQVSERVAALIDQAGSPSPRRRYSAAQVQSDEVVRALYDRAATGDAEALDRLCERVIPVLERQLTKVGGCAMQDWAHDAVQDAALEFRANVARFDPARGVPLLSFLKTAARRNLLNRMDAERRRASREDAGLCGDGFTWMVASRHDERIDLQRAVSAVWTKLSAVERRVFRLALKGERSTEVLARTADLAHLPVADQRRAVKRMTNRIFQRLRRQRGGGEK